MMTTVGQMHRIETPSAWVLQWSALASAGCMVLDVASGGGRNARHFAGLGHAVEAVDRDCAGLAELADVSNVTTRCADLEAAPWPYREKVFGVVVVTNYLHRPLFSHLLDAVAPGGVFIYETFALGNERFGRPSNPDYLLRPGELLDVVRGRCRVIAYEDVYVEQPRQAMVQRICARRES